MNVRWAAFVPVIYSQVAWAPCAGVKRRRRASHAAEAGIGAGAWHTDADVGGRGYTIAASVADRATREEGHNAVGDGRVGKARGEPGSASAGEDGSTDGRPAASPDGEVRQAGHEGLASLAAGVDVAFTVGRRPEDQAANV